MISDEPTKFVKRQFETATNTRLKAEWWHALQGKLNFNFFLPL